MAYIYSILGETDKALDQIEYAMFIPGYATPEIVAADPLFTELIKTERYQQLVETYRATEFNWR